MPFISFYPVGSDVQPLVGIIALILMCWMWFKNKLKFDKIDLIFIFIGILSLAYFSTFLEGDWVFRKRIGLLFSFFIFYVIKKLHLLFKFKVFYTVIWIYFLGALFHLLSPGLFAQFAGLFVRVIKQSSLANLTYRGVSSFAPEPGFLGALSVFFLLVLHYFNQREFVGRFYNWSTIALSLCMLSISKSGTGTVYFSLLILFWLYKKNVVDRNPWYLIGSLACVSLNAFAFLTSILAQGGGRGVSVLRQFLTNPFQTINDASIAHRISNIYTAIYSLQDYPLGTGVGTFPQTAQKMYYRHDLYVQFSDIKHVISDAVSAFAQYSVEMGFIFILFLVVVVLYDMYFCYTSCVFRVFAIVFLLFSFSISFPPTWFLLATTSRVTSNKIICLSDKLLINKHANYLF